MKQVERDEAFKSRAMMSALGRQVLRKISVELGSRETMRWGGFITGLKGE